MKSLFLFVILIFELAASEQILLVIANDFNTSQAMLQRYERKSGHYRAVGKPIDVNIGRNGLGWGEGKFTIPHSEGEPVKHEGDGKAPAGIFELRTAFGYTPEFSTPMPYRQATDDLICVDDSQSPFYNQLVTIDATKPVKSFEWMHRDDELYAIGITVAHNRSQKTDAGSCIFLHIEKGENLPTSGCTSMKRSSLETIAQWLRPDAGPLLVQIPKRYCSEIESRYPGIKCP